MNVKQWKIASRPPQVDIDLLRKSLNVSEATAILLLNRDIGNFDEAKVFFRPDLSHLHDPFEMKDMSEAVDRLRMAIVERENILIYGDYDVDGTTSVSMMYSFLKENFPFLILDYYVPDRYTEGYGVSLQGIEFARSSGFSLIITLDCGIKSDKALCLAKNYNIDVIVCDHHLPADVLPPAVAILDPKRTDCLYPYKELSGCGVGFKLLQGLCHSMGIEDQCYLKYLDYVAISICADIVPITGENRVLAYHGIKLMNKPLKPGIEALKSVAGIKSEINVHNIVFGFAPRINAAGRIEHAKASVGLLIAETLEEAMGRAKLVNDNNTTRKDFDSSITEEALLMIENDEFVRTAWSTVLFKNDWNKGVVGIVASRCIEKYHRPTIILTESNGKAVGSARSIPGFDLYKGIEECGELLEQYGGHMHAAGLTLKIENVMPFRLKFEEVVRKRISLEQLNPIIEVDLCIGFDEITQKFYDVIRQFSPFGPKNMQPVFVSNGVYFKTPIKIMKEEHIKMCLFQRDNVQAFDAIGFKMAHFISGLKENTLFRICYQIVENNFNNSARLELLLKDIQF